MHVGGVRVVDYPPVNLVRALVFRDLRVRVDTEVECIELLHAVTDLAFQLLQGATNRVGFLAARDLDHAAVLDIHADRFLPGRGYAHVARPIGKHAVEEQNTVDVLAVDRRVDPLRPGYVVAMVPTPGVVGHAGDALALHRIENVAFELRAVGVGHDELGHVVHERIGADVADHDHELMRCLCPLAHQERGGDGEHAHVPGLRFFDVTPKLCILFDGQVEREVDEQIGFGNSTLEDGRHAPLVLLHDLVDPDDRDVGAARRNHRLYPVDGHRIDQVLAAPSAVNVGPDEDLHAWLDLGVMVHQLDERVHRCFGNT